ncbi:hypothetical protein HanPSC8_Chr16g0697301 [Helianthus annuus]|nr:hypothetical protein HanPSC8_Chr16g0697301 [Helianthus annuus]
MPNFHSFIHQLKTTHHKKHGADHHPSSVICSSTRNIDSGGEALRYLSMYDLRYFKGHKDSIVLAAFQGILHLRGRPTVAYDQQGLVFAVSMEGGAIKLFDSRSYAIRVYGAQSGREAVNHFPDREHRRHPRGVPNRG